MSNKKSVELGNRYIMEVQVNNKASETNDKTYRNNIAHRLIRH